VEVRLFGLTTYPGFGVDIDFAVTLWLSFFFKVGISKTIEMNVKVHVVVLCDYLKILHAVIKVVTTLT
jgi:hypothetical protein